MLAVTALSCAESDTERGRNSPPSDPNHHGRLESGLAHSLPTPTPRSLPAPTSSQEPAKDSGCDQNYSGCVPIASDVDCAGGRGNGPVFVKGPIRVLGSDIYDLDRDHDGIACEQN